MELNQLPNFVIIFVAIGMLLGVGILVFDSFGTASKVLSGVENDSTTFTKWNTTYSLDHGNLTAFYSLKNASGVVIAPDNYTVDLTAGTIRLINYSAYPGTENATAYEGGKLNATYDYYNYDTQTSDVMDNAVRAASPISSTWMPLIVTVIILALVLAIVIRSFSTRR